MFIRPFVVVVLFLALAVLTQLIVFHSLPFQPFCSAASQPLCLTLTGVTTDSLDVSWYPPNTPRGDITDYKVRRGEEGYAIVYMSSIAFYDTGPAFTVNDMSHPLSDSSMTGPSPT